MNPARWVRVGIVGLLALLCLVPASGINIARATSVQGVYSNSFENGSDFMVGPGSPWWDNEIGPGSLYLRKGDLTPAPNTFELSSTVVHSGSYSAKLSLLNPVNDRSRRIHVEHNWDPIQDKDIFVECWHYLPADFVVDDWTDLQRGLEERWGSNTQPWVFGPYYNAFQLTVLIERTSMVAAGQYRLVSSINNGWVDNYGVGTNDLPTAYEVQSKDSIKFGQWFKITTYIHRDLQNGIYRMWLNDVLQWDLRDIRTIGILPERIASPLSGYHGSVASGISLYSGNWKQPNGNDWLGVHPKYAYYEDFMAWSPHDIGDNALVTANDIPTAMVAGQKYAFHITILNTGLTTWTSAEEYKLGDSSQFLPASSLPLQPVRRLTQALPLTVGPGEQYVFTFEITAPNSGGAYTLQYQMVRGAIWFGQATTTSVTVS